jgi:hypothetical protein
VKLRLPWFSRKKHGSVAKTGPSVASDLLARSRIDKPKALGVLLCYNDADILGEAIEYLLRNNHDVIAWDHGSDDGTAAVLDRFSGQLIERQFIPRDFDFYKLYGAMSQHLRSNYCNRYHWISWPDQDEFLEGPARDKSYYDYIRELVASPYNWVQFRNYNFWFTSEDDPVVGSAVNRIRRYCLYRECSARIRCWRASVTNDREFNHNTLEGERDPRWFNLRHYPMRNAEQMRRRLDKDRANLRRQGMNWHYENMKSAEKRLFIEPNQLHRDDGISELNPDPIFNWQTVYGTMPQEASNAARQT